MKKLFAILTTLMLLITELPSYNATGSSIIYGKIELTSASRFNVSIYINTSDDVKLGAMLLRIKYDNTAVKYIDKSAKLSNKLSTDKTDIYDNGNTVSILSGNKLGKLLPCGDNKYITLSFKKLTDNADIKIQLVCEEFIDVNCNAVNYSYIECITLKPNESIENSKTESNRYTSSSNSRNQADNSSHNSNTASDETPHDSNDKNNRDPSLLFAKSSSVKSMLIGGGIVLAISLIAFWGYRVGIKTAFNMQASLMKINSADNTSKENAKNEEEKDYTENEK